LEGLFHGCGPRLIFHYCWFMEDIGMDILARVFPGATVPCRHPGLRGCEFSSRMKVVVRCRIGLMTVISPRRNPASVQAGGDLAHEIRKLAVVLLSQNEELDIYTLLNRLFHERSLSLLIAPVSNISCR